LSFFVWPIANGHQLLAFLSLALLKAGILFVDNVQFAFATNDLAICASLFDGCSYFHFLSF
jgi:hypothetical protein